MSQEIKVEIELVKVRSNKRKFGSVIKGDLGGILVKGFFECRNVIG